MVTRFKRDLHADLTLCETATSGPWTLSGCRCWDVDTRVDGITGEVYEDVDAEFIAESREGWPEAIRRAIAAEAEVERLHAVLAQIATYGGVDMRGATCAQTAKEALDFVDV